MSSDTLELARRGFGAWQQGDFETIQAMLDPAVQWRWFEPGDWDCHSRDDVMRTLRERHAQGFGRSELEFVEAGGDAVIVVAHPRAVAGDDWPEEAAMIISFRDGKVVGQQSLPVSRDGLPGPSRCSMSAL